MNYFTRRALCCLVCVVILFDISSAGASGRYSKPEVKVWPETSESATTEKRPVPPELGRGYTLLDLVSLDASRGADWWRFYRPKTLAEIRLGEQDFKRPESLAGLAEQYMQLAQDYGQRVSDLDERLHLEQRRGRLARAAELATRKREQEQRTDEWLMGALKIYALLYHAPKYKNYAGMDTALTHMAVILILLKKTKNLDPILDRLQIDYPRSQFVDLGKMAMADLLSEQKDYQGALRIYKRISRSQNAKYAGYALYKSGRIYYALGDYPRALTAFAQAIERAEGEP